VNIDECYQLGYVIKPRGLKGELDVFIDSDFPENYKDLDSVFVEIEQKVIPFFIEYIRIRDNRAILKFEDVDAVDKAADLKGCPLHLPLELLPTLDENSFYFHDVLGFKIIDEKEGNIGTVLKFYNYPNQNLLAVLIKESEVLIPVNDHIIKKVDKGKKEISVSLPQGLIDIYTGN